MLVVRVQTHGVNQSIELSSMNERISRMKKRAAVALILSCFVSGLFAGGTIADEIGFLSPIVGSNPGVTIAGVKSGGAPWVVNHGFAVLNDEGRLRVDLRDLILPSVGTPGPVTAVAASVVCGDAVAATSDSVPLSVDGNAEIHAKLQVPSPCLGTIVLIRAAAFNGTPLPAPGPWIAATGLVKDSNSDRDN
jgi:hypothetical protein